MATKSICKYLLPCMLLAISAHLPAADSYRFERMWPTLQQPWYFYQPESVLVTDSGEVFVADTYNHRIVKMNLNGSIITTADKTGTTVGILNYPTAIAQDDDGFIYVADHDDDPREYIGIYKYDKDLNFQETILFEEVNPSLNNRIYGMDIYGDDLIVTVNNDISRPVKKEWTKEVRRISLSSKEIVDVWDPEVHKFDFDENSGGVRFDAQGNLYVATSQKINRYDLAGNLLDSWGEPGELNDNQMGVFSLLGPRGFDFDSEGNVFVCDSRTIEKYTTTGEFISQFTLGDLGFYESCDGLQVSESSEQKIIYVTGQRGIYSFSEDGKALSSWSSIASVGAFRFPGRLATDSAGFIYAQDGSTIFKFNEDIQLAAIFPLSGGSTTGIYIRDDKLYAAQYIRDADSGTNIPQISTFDLNGNFQSTVILNEGDARVFDFVITGNSEIIASTGRYDMNPFAKYWLVKYNNQGEVLAEENEFNYLALSYDSDDNIATSYSSENTAASGAERGVSVFDEDLNLLNKVNLLTSETKSLAIAYFGITVDSSNNYYLINSLQGSHEPKIYKINAEDGTYESFLEFGAGPNKGNALSDILINSKDEIFALDAGNLNIQKLIPINLENNSKAIVIAAGGPFPGNALWDSTQMTANFAYRTLTYQGFTKEDIYYLSSDTDLDLDLNGVADDVDADATNANLEYAITEWASDANNLVIYLVDHGGVDSFRMSGTEILEETELASWINELQSGIPGNVTIVYDACESGTFQDALIPPSGMDRTVITSTSPGENAVFISQGSVSFSNYFWTQVFNGLNTGDAFSLAGEALASTTDHQHPMLDVNADGISGPGDIAEVKQAYIGNGTNLSSFAPEIGGISGDQVLEGTNSAIIEAIGVSDPDGIARVWAVVRPPDYQQGNSGNPVLSLPTFDLTPLGNGNFSATWEEFTTEGTYLVSIYAMDRLGNTTVPRISSISVNNPLSRRAILVAGKDNGSQEGTSNNSANIAYDALLQQGYNDDTIYYLSDAGTIGIDGLPSAVNLEFALEEWAAVQTHDLVLYLTGSGENGKFHLNDTETVTDSELAGWVNSVAGEIPGTTTLVLDIDAGGSFMEALSDNNNRIIVSSTGANQNAHFFAGGDISFSKFYWRQVFNGATVRNAFVFATRAMRFASEQQEGQLDDNGDGIPNTKEDGRLARIFRHGSGILLAGDEPLINTLSISGEPANPLIEVTDITTTGEIDKVIAVITSPGGEDQTVSLLQDEDIYYRDNLSFTETGTYQLAVYAQDVSGNVSLPITGSFEATANTDPSTITTEEQELSTVITTDGTATTARFTAGAYRQNSSFRSESYTPGDSIIILGTVIPQADDIGKAADIFAVIRSDTADGTSFAYTDLDGNQIPWNGRANDLQPVKEVNALSKEETVSIYTGTLPAGTYRVFIGYMLASGGPIHFNLKAYKITVGE